MTTTELGGLVFHGTRHPSGLHFRRLIDWRGLPQSKGTVQPRPQAHGTFDSGEDYRDGAVPTIGAGTRASIVPTRFACSTACPELWVAGTSSA